MSPSFLFLQATALIRSTAIDQASDELGWSRRDGHPALEQHRLRAGTSLHQVKAPDHRLELS